MISRVHNSKFCRWAARLIAIAILIQGLLPFASHASVPANLNDAVAICTGNGIVWLMPDGKRLAAAPVSDPLSGLMPDCPWCPVCPNCPALTGGLVLIPQTLPVPIAFETNRSIPPRLLEAALSALSVSFVITRAPPVLS